ncbi:MAG TPA: sulfite exporter TauE/SafE family protein [Acetobacteraceae bacterium]|nr:sulfite exporter TauE/SafE family protein [Acetobacteraceae bacterium]
MAAVALAGIIRGASGFGQALIFVPLAGLLYPPATAVPLLWVAGATVTPLMLRPHLRSTDWSEVLHLALGAALTLPFGVWLLGHASAVFMRWIISTLVLLCTFALAAGWRIRLPQRREFGILLGGMSGLTGGATGMGGPPLILCWLGGRADAATIRSNIFVYLWLLGLMELTVGTVGGLVPRSVLTGGLALAPAYGSGILVGNWLFRHSVRLSPERRDRMFRWVALGICAASACAGLPVWR